VLLIFATSDCYGQLISSGPAYLELWVGSNPSPFTNYSQTPEPAFILKEPEDRRSHYVHSASNTVLVSSLALVHRYVYAYSSQRPGVRAISSRLNHFIPAKTKSISHEPLIRKKSEPVGIERTGRLTHTKRSLTVSKGFMPFGRFSKAAYSLYASYFIGNSFLIH
jgi:hypothetical protein